MKKSIFIAFVVSLGGFLFGFDAGIISGVMSYVNPEYNLDAIQSGWVVSSPSFAAMFAMLLAGRLSDFYGRKKILLYVAVSYVISALLSAYSISYEMLYLARMLGGLAFGAALILAPTYIAEISTGKNRGKLVSIQQLNIVLGFFAAFLSNYYFNAFNEVGSSFLNDTNVWRWMLGVEILPAILYFVLLFFVPKSPRWLFLKKRNEEAKKVMYSLHNEQLATEEISAITESLLQNKNQNKVKLSDLFKPALRFIIIVGLVLAVLQQITGINAIYFYATSIFKQTGIGTGAAFKSGILLSLTTVVFTILAIVLIDRLGRRPLLLVGIAGISISLLVCAYGFNNATYQLTTSEISSYEGLNSEKLISLADKTYTDDVSFKRDVKQAIGNREYQKFEGAILEKATDMNAKLVLFGILGFIACFAFSLGPVMWVMLSELYPNAYRGLAIGSLGFVNSFVSWGVQQVFPWELDTLGSTMTFFIFGVIALIGFFILLKILPETKGKSLEELEKELVKS